MSEQKRGPEEAEGIILRELQRAVESRAQELGLRWAGAVVMCNAPGGEVSYYLGGRVLRIVFSAQEAPQLMIAT